MKANDYAQMCALINAACEYYGRPALTDNALRIYFNGLKHLTIEQVQEGLSVHVGNPDNGQFMPKVADITRAVLGDSEAMADRAWAKVYAAIGSVGRYQSVVFDDPLVHVVVSAMGGWVKLCVSDNEEVKWAGKDFVRMYRGYAGQALPDYPRHLPGLSEIDNSARGYRSAPPLLVGNREQARLVFEGGSDAPALPAAPMQISDTLKRLGFEHLLGGAA